jgi:hypothetical protein
MASGASGATKNSLWAFNGKICHLIAATVACCRRGP